MAANKLSGTTVALAIGLSGCGVEHTVAPLEQQPTGQQPSTVNPSDDKTSRDASRTTLDLTARKKMEASVKQSLESLNALQLFVASGLVEKQPIISSNCYVCSVDEAVQEASDAELIRQEARLAKLLEQALECNSGNCYLFRPNSADEAVQALNALEIVKVESLVVAQPKNNPECYNLPCPSDIEAAKSENEHRALITNTIATYAKHL